MRSSLDSVVYLNGKVTCAGWAAPEMAGDEVCLTIRKEDGSILDAQVSRVKRADVGQVIYQDASFDKYGLTFSFEPGEMTTCYAVFTSKGTSRGCIRSNLLTVRVFGCLSLSTWH